jgi:hypothetical protein
MKDFIGKYGKTILYAVLGLVVLFILFKGGNYIYKNTFSHEKYQYTLKSFQNQVFDQNVSIAKKIKHNGAQGEFRLTFAKKDLSEEYVIPVDISRASGNVEFSIEGKLDSGDMNIKMVDDQNKDVFNKVVKGANIREVSTQDYKSTLYKFVFTPNGALNGDLIVKYKIK